MIHYFSEDFIFELPSGFTDPFRYSPHPSVIMAAVSVTDRIGKDKELASWLSEGKMLGVLVCRQKDSLAPCYIAAFSGNVGGRSHIDGFVPPIFDLTDPGSGFKRREAEISSLNRSIEDLLSSEEYSALQKELAEAEDDYRSRTERMKSDMARSKAKRNDIRKNYTDPDTLAGLERQSQHEKAELKRLKESCQATIATLKSRLKELTDQVDALKSQRAAMSESLQDWIFSQYIVHNALGEESSVADIFARRGMTPPGGTGECAAPKLLEFAYRNDLQPLAMGEFWYGKESETAVRVHGHFYPSCTSKCGPLLEYMTRGLHIGRGPGHEHIPGPIVLHEDETLIIVEKPCGMPSVPGLDGRTSLQEMLGRTGGVHAVHRLDMDTSGVMIYAKNSNAAINLRQQFEAQTVRKTYMARLASVPVVKSGVIDLSLGADYDERPRQKVDYEQGKTALTEYETTAINNDGTADLLLYPHTGRTHQLRVHCAHALGLSCPILGDTLYGSRTLSSAPQQFASRLCLHALSITFTHPATGERVTFTSDRLCY